MTIAVRRGAIRPTLLGLAFASLLICLSGCGGGGGSLQAGGSGINTNGGNTTRAALTGLVSAPASQTRAARLSGRDADTLVPVGGATVTLLDLNATDPTAPVDTTKTDANGNYTFTKVTAGDNYQIVATKSVPSGTLTLCAIVTPPTTTTNTTPVTRNLDPVTTVAAVAVQAQLTDLKKTDPNAGKDDLQTIAQALEQKHDANTPPPDLTNPTAVAAAATTLQAAAAPVGSYVGTATGDTDGTKTLAALIDKNGKFFITALPDPSQMQNNGGNPSSTGMGSNNPPQGPGDGSQTGTGQGGNSSPGPGDGSGTGTNPPTGQGGQGSGNGNDNGKNNNDNFAVGSVDANGIVNAQTKNGSITIHGVFTGGVGVGTWQQNDGSGKKGTWTLKLLTDQWAGLYAGKYTDPDNTKGDFAAVILDDHSVTITGADSNGGSVYGTGTVDSTGQITFTVQSPGGTVTGTGKINLADGTLTGSYTDGTQTGTFIGRRTTADTSDL